VRKTCDKELDGGGGAVYSFPGLNFADWQVGWQESAIERSLDSNVGAQAESPLEISFQLNKG
jgi:hypothetical protein